MPPQMLRGMDPFLFPGSRPRVFVCSACTPVSRILERKSGQKPAAHVSHFFRSLFHAGHIPVDDDLGERAFPGDAGIAGLFAHETLRKGSAYGKKNTEDFRIFQDGAEKAGVGICVRAFIPGQCGLQFFRDGVRQAFQQCLLGLVIPVKGIAGYARQFHNFRDGNPFIFLLSHQLEKSGFQAFSGELLGFFIGQAQHIPLLHFIEHGISFLRMRCHKNMAKCDIRTQVY